MGNFSAISLLRLMVINFLESPIVFIYLIYHTYKCVVTCFLNLEQSLTLVITLAADMGAFLLPLPPKELARGPDSLYWNANLLTCTLYHSSLWKKIQSVISVWKLPKLHYRTRSLTRPPIPKFATLSPEIHPAPVFSRYKYNLHLCLFLLPPSVVYHV